jgi:peptidoglycan/LPS O-acetylase OafA/YrhL
MLGACLLLSLAWQVYVYHLIGFSHSWQPLFASYYHSLFGRFFEFALGIAAAHLAVHPLKKQNLIAFLAILILFAPALYYSTHISRFGPLMDQTWGVIFTSFILLCHSVRSHRIWKTTVFRILAWLGGFSYSLYLMQILAKNFAGSIVSFLRTENFGFLTRHDLFAHMIFSLPLAIAFGWLFYLIFEKKDSALNRAIQSWSFFRFPESKKSA